MLVIGQCHRNLCLHDQKQSINGEKKMQLLPHINSYFITTIVSVKTFH